MCYEVVLECEIKEISSIINPGNKHCRVMGFPDNDGRMIDTSTLRAISEVVLGLFIPDPMLCSTD
jgi:hypothetical protein